MSLVAVVLKVFNNKLLSPIRDIDGFADMGIGVSSSSEWRHKTVRVSALSSKFRTNGRH